MDFIELLVLMVLSSLYFKSYHVLSFLISIEMMVILLFFFLFFLMPSFFFYSFLLYIAIMACESAVGLILFVLLNRFFSKDYVLLLSILKF